MTTEQWRSIAGYEGIYAISDFGNVMSMDYKGSGLPGLLKPLCGAKYLRVCLCRNGKESYASIHSLVMLAFVGIRPAGMQINHKDGVKKNNSLSNLEYCTSQENNLHALRNGLRALPNGERHWRAKLTEAKIMEIRSYIAAGMSQKAIAEMMAVSASTISYINSGRRWGHMNSDRLKAKNLQAAV